MTRPLAASLAGLVGLAAGAALGPGCASEETSFPDDSASHSDGGVKGLGGIGGSFAVASTSAGKAGTGPVNTASGGSAGHGAGATSNAGGPSSSAGASTTGGHAGAASEGGHGGSAGSSGGSPGGTAGSASGGGSSQPAMCDEATATTLGSMSSNVTVASNVCLKMTLPVDQSWIKKVTLQPEGGMYPLPFTWSNCGTNSNGAFTANYANSVLNPVTADCPVFVKLEGNGSPINVQWWGG